MSDVLEIPNIWKSGVTTKQGLGLLAKLIEGNTLKITRAETGAGWVDPDLLDDQTAVAEPMQALTFSTVSYPEDGKCMIPCKLTNEKITESYVARQIGLYAEDPDEGEILFFIVQVADDDSGTGIPAADVVPSYSATWNLVIYYGMADGVSVTVDPAGALTHEEMVTYVSEAIGVLTNADIDAAAGFAGGDGGDSTGGTTGAGTLDHSALYNRNIDDQHTMNAITGLEEALAAAEGETIATTDVESAWNDAI